MTDKEVRRNVDLENQIKLMIRLIRRAPAFDKSHTVYRFIVDDSFLSHLKVGDTYQDVSFMSTNLVNLLLLCQKLHLWLYSDETETTS